MGFKFKFTKRSVNANQHQSIPIMTTLILVPLLAVILCAALTESKPAAWRQRYRTNNYRRNYGRSYSRGRSYSSGGSQPNQLLKKIGTAKIVAGAGLTGLGLV